MTSPAKQNSQHGDFRRYLPDLSSPRFTTLAQCDAYSHAKELTEKHRPPWLYGLYTHWRKLLEEPFKGVTNDGGLTPRFYFSESPTYCAALVLYPRKTDGGVTAKPKTYARN